MTEPTQPSDQGSVRSDLDLVVGGSLNVDHIGQQAYDEVVDRIRSHPQAYLAAVESRYLGADFDALLQSRSHLPRLLELLVTVDPDATRATASSLLRHLDAALVIYDDVEDKQALPQFLPEESVNTLSRLDVRRTALQALLERED